MKYTLFIFRRDLRLFDNNTLNYCIKHCKNILPIFIFTPEQIDNNDFKSNNAIQFMNESLNDLSNELSKYNSILLKFYGHNIDVLNDICKTVNIENIAFNKDYTPYAIERDNQIKDFCEKNNINFTSFEDYLLSNIGELNKPTDNKPYTVYTPFKNNGLKHEVNKPTNITIKNLTKTTKLKQLENSPKYEINNHILVNGGRKEALKKLNLIKKQSNYNKDRNTLSIQTSLLSAYIKFGNLSIREVFHKIKKELGINNELINQLYWREFYFYIAYYFPNVLKGENYNKKYDKIKWNNNKEYFKAWCNGKTGYPIVDAAMTELNTIGYMHNRGRLISANFMNRMLGLDWRLGEKYFAYSLTDYDPAVNNGNWQWIASTGVDPKPYFQRLFNPWLQGEKFDKDAKYIKKWLPQLKNIPAKELNNWEKYYKNYDLKKINYYKPIVDYKEARQKSVKMYREIL